MMLVYARIDNGNVLTLIKKACPLEQSWQRSENAIERKRSNPYILICSDFLQRVFDQL